MAKYVAHSDLVELVARRMLSDMKDHGDVGEFCDKLIAFPEQYISELAAGAIDCISLSNCLSSRVDYKA